VLQARPAAAFPALELSVDTSLEYVEPSAVFPALRQKSSSSSLTESDEANLDGTGAKEGCGATNEGFAAQ
jgi:hypothetical protein